MEPTISHNSILFVDKIYPKLSKIKVNDIIVFKSMIEENVLICKRVVGVENDVINLNDRKIKIKSNYLWTEGDNSLFSYDSRNYGPISNYLVVGKVRFSIYQKFSFVK